MPNFPENCDLLGSIDDLIEAGGRTKTTLQREANVISSFCSFLTDKFQKVRHYFEDTFAGRDLPANLFFYFLSFVAMIFVHMKILAIDT